MGLQTDKALASFDRIATTIAAEPRTSSIASNRSCWGRRSISDGGCVRGFFVSFSLTKSSEER